MAEVSSIAADMYSTSKWSSYLKSVCSLKSTIHHSSVSSSVRNYHKGVKYQCGTCEKQFSSKDNLDLHHKTLEHSGEGRIFIISVLLPWYLSLVSNLPYFFLFSEVVIEAPVEMKKEDGCSENSLHCDKCNKEFLTKEDFEVQNILFILLS